MLWRVERGRSGSWVWFWLWFWGAVGDVVDVDSGSWGEDASDGSEGGCVDEDGEKRSGNRSSIFLFIHC